jgi:hypothetical protein
MTGSRDKRGVSKSLIAAAAAAPLLMAAPASAQWFGDPVMPPRAIGRIVMQQGYSGFSPPRLAGDVYIVNAIDQDGARVRLVIDAYDGRILRPVRSVEELAPPRRARPRDDAAWPEADDDIERDGGRFGTRRPAREALVPPRSIGREPLEPLPRQARIDLDREPSEAPSLGREQRPTAAVRKEPAPERPTARVEQPARQAATPAKPSRPREAARPAPAVTPAVPVPIEPPKPEPAAKPTTTAAAPAPAAPKETGSTTPAAPAPAIEPAKAEASRPREAAAPPQPAPQPAATASASGAPVRVIGGVTPVLPQSSASPQKPSSEPNTTVQ